MPGNHGRVGNNTPHQLTNISATDLKKKFMQKENNCFITKTINTGVFSDDRRYQPCCFRVFFDKIEHIANISFTFFSLMKDSIS